MWRREISDGLSTEKIEVVFRGNITEDLAAFCRPFKSVLTVLNVQCKTDICVGISFCDQ